MAVGDAWCMVRFATLMDLPHLFSFSQAYLDFVDEWMQAIKFRWPNALIQASRLSIMLINSSRSLSPPHLLGVV